MYSKNILSSCIGLLKEINKFTIPVDKIISNFFYKNRQIPQNSREILVHTTYTYLRNYYKINTVLQDASLLEIIVFIWLYFFKIEQTVLLGFVKKDLLNKLDKIYFKDDISSLTELPLWLYEKLEQQYTKDEIDKLTFSFSNEAPLDLRINTLLTSIEEVIDFFKTIGVKFEKTPYSPYGIRLFSKQALIKNPLFLDGKIEVQDEGSQLIGLLLAPKRNQIVVDFCAGAGGKTLLFGMLMQNTGRIYAFDINAKRLNNLSSRIKRAKLTNVFPQTILNENDDKVKRLYDKVDKVFVDAPCSGLGTLRRNPDLKLRQSNDTIKSLNIQQINILTAASRLVKVNGFIVYATCSILKEENENIIDEFLKQHKNFIIVDANSSLQIPNLNNASQHLKLMTYIHNTDGFFATLMQRIN